MPLFTQSNITLSFPDQNFFRFSGCAGYTQLSGNNFKEMDACWYDAHANLYWLFELKNYSMASIASAETVEQKAWDMVKKAIDSLMMFLSGKHGYAHSASLNPCFPIVPNPATQFKFITIVHCEAAQIADVQLINESFRRKFKPYAQLFDIKHYSVLEHRQAMRILPNMVLGAAFGG